MSPQSTRGRSDEEQRELNRRMERWSLAVAVFNGCLVLTSVIGNLFIWLQWNTAADAQRDTREQLKAVMQVTGVQTLAGPGNNGEPILYGFMANIQNLGGTRTGPVRGWQSVGFFDRAIPNNLDLSKPSEEIKAGAFIDTIVGANSAVTFGPVTLTQEQIDKLNRKEGAALLWGRLTYSDVFEPKRERVVTFCLTLTTQRSKEGLVLFTNSPHRGDCNRST